MNSSVHIRGGVPCAVCCAAFVASLLKRFYGFCSVARAADECIRRVDNDVRAKETVARNMRAALSGGVHLTQDEAQVAGVHTHASASCLLSLSTHHTHQVGRQKTVTKRRRKTVAQSVV